MSGQKLHRRRRGAKAQNPAPPEIPHPSYQESRAVCRAPPDGSKHSAQIGPTLVELAQDWPRSGRAPSALVRAPSQLIELRAPSRQRISSAAGLSKDPRTRCSAQRCTCLQTFSQREGKPSLRAWVCVALVAVGPHSCHGLPRGPAHGIMAWSQQRPPAEEFTSCRRGRGSEHEQPKSYPQTHPTSQHRIATRAEPQVVPNPIAERLLRLPCHRAALGLAPDEAAIARRRRPGHELVLGAGGGRRPSAAGGERRGAEGGPEGRVAHRRGGRGTSAHTRVRKIASAECSACARAMRRPFLGSSKPGLPAGFLGAPSSDLGDVPCFKLRIERVDVARAPQQRPRCRRTAASGAASSDDAWGTTTGGPPRRHLPSETNEQRVPTTATTNPPARSCTTSAEGSAPTQPPARPPDQPANHPTYNNVDHRAGNTTVLCHTVLHNTALHCTVRYCTAMRCTAVLCCTTALPYCMYFMYCMYCMC